MALTHNPWPKLNLMFTNPTWSDDQKRILRELWPNESSSMIGNKIGKSRNAVIGMARRMKLPAKAPAGGGSRPGQVRKAPASKVIHSLKMVPMTSIKHKPEPKPYSGPVPFMDVLPWQCRSIEAEKGLDGLPMFCGKQIVEGQVFSYCSEHLKLYTSKGYAR